MEFAADGCDLLDRGPDYPSPWMSPNFPVQVVVAYAAVSTLDVVLRWRDGAGSQSKKVTITR
jgi:hypothetical protein